MMEILNHIPFTLDSGELMKRLHIRPGSEDAGEFAELLCLARKIGQPKAIYSEAYVEFTGEDTVVLDGIRFTSQMLRNNLAQVDRVFPYIVTCGREMDEAEIPTGNLLTTFWWDAVKESLLRSASQHLLDLLERKYLLKKIASMNPGSGDANVWPIEQQQELFALFGNVRQQIGVELTGSFLMVPNKTISGIFFPTEKDFRTCQVCHRENCPNRSAAFNQELWASII